VFAGRRPFFPGDARFGRVHLSAALILGVPRRRPRRGAYLVNNTPVNESRSVFCPPRLLYLKPRPEPTHEVAPATVCCGLSRYLSSASMKQDMESLRAVFTLQSELLLRCIPLCRKLTPPPPPRRLNRVVLGAETIVFNRVSCFLPPRETSSSALKFSPEFLFCPRFWGPGPERSCPCSCLSLL